MSRRPMFTGHSRFDLPQQKKKPKQTMVSAVAIDICVKERQNNTRIYILSTTDKEPFTNCTLRTGR